MGSPSADVDVACRDRGGDRRSSAGECDGDATGRAAGTRARPGCLRRWCRGRPFSPQWPQLGVPGPNPDVCHGSHDDERIFRDEVFHVLLSGGGGDKQGTRFGLVLEWSVGDHCPSVGKGREVPLMLVEEADAQRISRVIRVMDGPQRHETILGGWNRSWLVTVVPVRSKMAIRTHVRRTSRRVAL